MNCIKEIENNRLNKHNSTIPISFERSRYYFHFREHVILAVMYVSVISVSIIANSLIILIVPSRKKLWTPMDLMLVNLCLSHLVSSLFAIAYVFILDAGDIASEKTWSLTCAFTETLHAGIIAVGISVSMLCMLQCTICCCVSSEASSVDEKTPCYCCKHSSLGLLYLRYDSFDLVSTVLSRASHLSSRPKQNSSQR